VRLRFSVERGVPSQKSRTKKEGTKTFLGRDRAVQNRVYAKEGGAINGCRAPDDTEEGRTVRLRVPI